MKDPFKGASISPNGLRIVMHTRIAAPGRDIMMIDAAVRFLEVGTLAKSLAAAQSCVSKWSTAVAASRINSPGAMLSTNAEQ